VKRASGLDTIAASGTLVSTACAVLPELSVAACLTIAGTRCAVSQSLDAQAVILVAFRDASAKVAWMLSRTNQVAGYAVAI
jgi:hypothetical protein